MDGIDRTTAKRWSKRCWNYRQMRDKFPKKESGAWFPGSGGDPGRRNGECAMSR